MTTAKATDAVTPETTETQAVVITEETPTATDPKPEVKKNTAKKNATDTKAFDEGKEHGKVMDVPIASIVQYDNPRHEPENLYSAGYILFGDSAIDEVDPDESDSAKFVSLAHMALHPEYAASYVALIEEYEAVDRKQNAMAPQTIVELAQDIEDCGQLVPVLLRKESKGYIGIDGGRRIAAILYLHAKSLGTKKVRPATVLATTASCKPGEVFLRSMKANLSRKDFTAMQEGLVYHEMLQTVNPATKKKWTMKDGAAALKVEYGTFRNREALWRDHDPETGRGLTEKQRDQVAAGELGVTKASRIALGERHFADTGKTSGKRNTGLPLSEMQKLFDESAEANKERRTAIAECMGVKLAQAVKESEARIEKQDEADLKKNRK